MILAHVINGIQRFLRKSNNVTFQSPHNLPGCRQNRNNDIVQKVPIKIHPEYFVSVTVDRTFVAASSFCNKVALTACYKYLGIPRCLHVVGRQCAFLWSQKIYPFSLESKKEFVAVVTMQKGFKKSMPFSFIISSSSSSLMPFYRWAYEMLVQNSWHYLVWYLHWEIVKDSCITFFNSKANTAITKHHVHHEDKSLCMFVFHPDAIMRMVRLTEKILIVLHSAL